MKTYIPRLIAWGVLFLLGALAVLTSFSVELLCIVGVTLAVIAAGIFMGSYKSLTKAIPWLAAGGVLLGILIPSFGLTIQGLVNGLKYLAQMLVEPSDGTLLTIGFIATIGAQLFFRKSESILLIVARYVAVSLLLFGAQQALFPGTDLYKNVIITIVLLSLAYELQTQHYGYHERRTLSCILCTLGCFAVAAVYSYPGAQVLESLFALESGWLYVVIGTAILGGLLVLEEYNHRAVQKQSASAHANLGGALLFWSLQCLIMHMWEDTFHWTALILVPIVLYYCYGHFIGIWKKRAGFSERKTFLTVWSLITLGNLMVGKSLNNDPMLAILMAALLVAAAVCWRVSVRGKNEKLIMSCYLGVAAAVLLTGALAPDWEDLAELSKTILAVAMTGISWCFLCVTTDRLDRQASAIHPTEFKAAVKAELYVPLAVMAFTAVYFLFS